MGMATMRKNKNVPAAAVLLILIGSLLILASGILAIIGITIGVAFVDGHLMIMQLQGITIYHGILEMLVGVALVSSVIYMKFKDGANAQDWLAIALVLSVISLIGGGGLLIGFVLVLMGGIFGLVYVYSVIGRQVYIRHVRAPERKHTTVERLLSSIMRAMSPEEKKLYSLVGEAEGAIFQAELVEKSGYSKAKVSRILDRLEGKGLIERKRRGMTNMVVLKKPE